jgi:hypothetical protein
VQAIHRQVDRVKDEIEAVHNMAVRVKEFQLEVNRKEQQAHRCRPYPRGRKRKTTLGTFAKEDGYAKGK